MEAEGPTKAQHSPDASLFLKKQASTRAVAGIAPKAGKVFFEVVSTDRCLPAFVTGRGCTSPVIWGCCCGHLSLGRGWLELGGPPCLQLLAPCAPVLPLRRVGEASF